MLDPLDFGFYDKNELAMLIRVDGDGRKCEGVVVWMAEVWVLICRCRLLGGLLRMKQKSRRIRLRWRMRISSTNRSWSQAVNCPR